MKQTISRRSTNMLRTLQSLLLILTIVFASSCKKDDVIVKKDSVITWENPADIYEGTALSATQLNATADREGTFLYTPALGAKLALGAAQDLKVIFSPTDSIHYNTTIKTVKINVIAKLNPVITWANPADIYVGTALSSTQLNATADREGIFVYTPAIGTKLAVGAAQDLKVTFSPTDSIHYNSATNTVKINVINYTDADGNVFHAVTIGTQTWMLENLKTTKFNDGTALPNVTGEAAWNALTTPAYCWYNNDANNKNIYGALYNWYAVNTGKLCPTGWHVPSDEEWTTMENYLIANGYNYDGSTTENKIAKALASTSGWNSSSEKGTIGNNDYPSKRNASGFTALPGGWRYSGGFDLIGRYCAWWSTTSYGTDRAWARGFLSNYDYLHRGEGEKKIGFAIRCIKD